MNTQRTAIRRVALLLAPLWACASAQTPVGTGFTYQGRLVAAGQPYNGNADLIFRLYGRSSGGSQLAPPVAVNALPIADGLLSVDLDFGQNVFLGDQRWLEIEVNATTLAPRQPIRPAPYALFALTGNEGPPGPQGPSGPPGDSHWQLNGSATYYNNGNVGIGTDSPSHRLTVASPDEETVRLIGPDGTFLHGARLNFGDGDYVYLDEDEDDHLSLYARVGTSLLGGNVGVGTPSPAERLTVQGGDIRLENTAGQRKMQIFQDNAGAAAWIMFNASGNRFISATSMVTNLDHGALAVGDNSSVQKAIMFVDDLGRGTITADVKNFRTPSPRDPQTEIWYACVEGPEVAAYLRGTASLVNGRATVRFPEHFADVCGGREITVYLTPLSADSRGLAGVEKRADGFVVAELQGGRGGYAFDYLVMDVRAGYADYQVLRPRRQLLAIDVGGNQPAANPVFEKPGNVTTGGGYVPTRATPPVDSPAQPNAEVETLRAEVAAVRARLAEIEARLVGLGGEP